LTFGKFDTFDFQFLILEQTVSRRYWVLMRLNTDWRYKWTDCTIWSFNICIATIITCCESGWGCEWGWDWNWGWSCIGWGWDWGWNWGWD
jgi:hypothetical protein